MFTGPNIITDGLVLALDTVNSRSFRGEPTTNLAASGGLIGMSGITLTDLGLEDGWRKYSMSGTFTGGTYPYIMRISGYTFTGGVLYSSKCTVKTNVGFKFNYFGANGLSYVNEPMSNGGTLSSTQNSDGSYTIARIGFAYTNTTNQPGYLWTNPINNTSFNSSTDFVYIKELQVEQKAYATPFVNGTRGTTVATGGGWGDTSGNNNHGELVNGPTFNTANGGSILFDGVNDYIITPNSTTLNITSTITLESWIKSTTLANSSHGDGIFSKGLSADNNSGVYETLLAQSGGVNYPFFRMRIGAVTPTYFPTNIPIILNQLYHIVSTYNGSIMRIFVNGVESGTGLSTTGTIQSNTQELAIGVRYNRSSDSYFNGNIYLSKIYNRALSAQEIFQNYNATKSRFNL